jgi:putative hemolysin
LHLSQDPGKFLSTVQVGITIVGTLAATFGGAALASDLADWIGSGSPNIVREHRTTIAVGIITLAISAVSLVLGELAPKRVALQSAEQIARFVALPMSLLSRCFRPFVVLLGAVTSSILWLLRVKSSARPSVSMEDIEHLIETGHAEGALNVSERDVALEALQLGDRKVKDIMQPRVDMEALDVDTPADEIMGAIAMAGFSRIPVYEESLDKVLGFVYIKDVFLQVYLGRPIELRKLLHPPLFVPEALTLDRVLDMFQSHQTQLAIVVDEFGGTAGLVTMEDVLEELVGEIHDEHRRDTDLMFVRRDDGSWLVDGGMSVHDFVELLHEKLPQLETAMQAPEDISTVSGVVLQEIQRIPKVGEKLQWHGVSMEVVDMDGARIDRILVSFPEQPAEAAAPPDS